MDETIGLDTMFVGVAVLFIVIMAIRAWTHGALGMLWALCSWAAGIAAGIWTYRNGTVLLQQHGGIDLAVTGSAVASIVLAIAAFIIARLLAKSILQGLFGPHSILGWWMHGPTGAVLSLLPSCAIILLFALLIRGTGTVRELQRLDLITNSSEYWDPAKFPETPFFTKWRNGLEQIPGVEKLLDQTDPIGSTEKRNLVAFLLASHSASAGDRLRARSQTSGIANDKYVNDVLMKDEEIQKIVGGQGGNFKYFRLLRHPLVEQGAKRPDLRHRLTPVDMGTEIQSALTEKEKEKKKSWLQRIFS